MTDILDRAKELEMQQRDVALKNHQAAAKQTEPPLVIDGQRCCRACEEPIPAERLKASPDAVRCVWCQQDFELKQKTSGCC